MHVIGKIWYERYKTRDTLKSLDIVVGSLRVALYLTKDESLLAKAQTLSEIAESIYHRYIFLGTSNVRGISMTSSEPSSPRPALSHL